MEDQIVDTTEQPMDWHKDKITYEDIILKQINRCISNLSKDRIGGFTTQTGAYINDVFEEVINSIKSLEYLMIPFIKNKDFKKEIEDVKKEIENYAIALGEEQIQLKNKPRCKVKDAGGLLPPNHPIILRRKSFEAEKYEQIFSILMRIYQKRTSDFKAASYE